MTELQNDIQDKNNMSPIFDLRGIKIHEYDVGVILPILFTAYQVLINNLEQMCIPTYKILPPDKLSGGRQINLFLPGTIRLSYIYQTLVQKEKNQGDH